MFPRRKSQTGQFIAQPLQLDRSFAGEEQLHGEDVAGGELGPGAHQLWPGGQRLFELAEIELPATFDESGFQDAVLRSDGVALEDMGDGVAGGILLRHGGRNLRRLSVGRLDHLAQGPLVKEPELPELGGRNLVLKAVVENSGSMGLKFELVWTNEKAEASRGKGAKK